MQKEPNIFGFTSIEDFMESCFRFNNWILNSVGATTASLSTFITGYMWDTEAAVWTLWILMGADWATGILKSVKAKKFVSYKIFRMPAYYLITSFLIAISWHMAKNSIIFVPLPAIVLGGFYAVYFSSLLENLAELEILPKPVIKILKKFGMKVIMQKYFNTEEDARDSKKLED
jgi:phage-related holin